jgi:hypothetical protein
VLTGARASRSSATRAASFAWVALPCDMPNAIVQMPVLAHSANPAFSRGQLGYTRSVPFREAAERGERYGQKPFGT